MIFWLIKKMLYQYLNIYLKAILLAPFLLFIFCWFVFSHVDKMHLREKGRLYGYKVSKYIKNDFIKNNVIAQLNSFSEVTTGFTDGILSKTPIVKIVKIIESDCQTDPIDPIIVTRDIEKPIIIEKEVIKEVEKIVYINKENSNNISITKSENSDNVSATAKNENNNGTNIFDLFEKPEKTTKNEEKNIFLEDAENDEKTLGEFKNKVPEKKTPIIKLIPKNKKDDKKKLNK